VSFEPAGSHTPRVSVLMPMKNAAAYVSQAVRSILRQDHTDLELIVVDDGSSDGSRRIVQEIGDPRVRIIAGPGRGPGAAWNVGFAVAAGSFLLQCDADDAFPPARITGQVKFLDEHPEFGAVCAGFSMIDSSGRHVVDLGSGGAEEVTQEMLRGGTRTHLCTFAIRRSHLVAIGGKREYFETAEDIDLMLRLCEVCRIFYEPVDRYHYRLHGASITHTQPSRQRQFFEQYARELRSQRAHGGQDDLERGAPRAVPASDSTRDGHRRHIQGMLIGEAWRRHDRGAKLDALRLGLRAIAQAPTSAEAWRSVAALAFKAAGSGGRS
jgi:glycosyltransferase involved in cell wall biosynthesis